MPLRPPPRDASGAVVPHDHADLGSADIVFRRVSDEQIVEKDGRRVVSSMAFKGARANGGMSVDIEAVIVAHGHEPRRFLTTPRWIGSVSLVVGELRRQGLLVGYAPLPENVAHGEVWGITGKSLPRAIKRMARWFVRIEGVDLE